jgi:AcrR family transcriptional regulator
LPGRILAVARQLFLEQGYGATSLQQIAGRAGVTKRTVYVKLGDKATLFSAVVEDVLAGWKHALNGIDASGPLQTRLEQIGLQILDLVLARDVVRLVRVVYGETHRFPELVELMARQTEDGLPPRLAALLAAERRARGAPRGDELKAASMLHEMIVAWPLRQAIYGRAALSKAERLEWVQAAIRLFLNGWRSSARRENAS